MTKKIILSLVVLITSISPLTSEIIKYKVISDTFYSNGGIQFSIPIKKDTNVTWKSNSSVLPRINDNGIYENFLMDINYNNETIYMLSSDLQVIDTEIIVDQKKLFRIIPEYYLDVLYEKKINLIFENQPVWKERKKRIENEPFPFEDSFQPESYYISNTIILFSQHNYYLVRNVKSNSNIQEIDLVRYSDDGITDSYGKKEDVFSDVYSLFRNDKEITLILQKDGDFFDIWINTTDNYIGRYIVASDSLCEELLNLVKNKNCDLTKITWPRHADGTCDYEANGKSSSAKTVSTSTNVAVNKTLTTNCNLKLRSGEATSTQVLTVMSAGTKVKILELGKAETIDGINSNWVKVEVQSGAKDRDGKEIKAGTVGWCYGGYLE